MTILTFLGVVLAAATRWRRSRRLSSLPTREAALLSGVDLVAWHAHGDTANKTRIEEFFGRLGVKSDSVAAGAVPAMNAAKRAKRDDTAEFIRWAEVGVALAAAMSFASAVEPPLKTEKEANDFIHSPGPLRTTVEALIESAVAAGVPNAKIEDMLNEVGTFLVDPGRRVFLNSGAAVVTDLREVARLQDKASARHS